MAGAQSLVDSLFEFFGIQTCQGAKRSGILIDNPLNFPAPCDCYDDAFFWPGAFGKTAWKALPKSVKIRILSSLGLINFIKNRASSVFNATRITKLQAKSKELLDKIEIKEKVIEALEKLYDRKLAALNNSIKNLANDINIKKNNYTLLKNSIDSTIDRVKKLNIDIPKKAELYNAQERIATELKVALNENSRRLNLCKMNVPRADQQLVCGPLQSVVEKQTEQWANAAHRAADLRTEGLELTMEYESLKENLIVKKFELENAAKSINADEKRIWSLENEELPNVRRELNSRVQRELSGLGDPDLSDIDESLEFLTQREDAIQERLDQVTKDAGWGEQVDEEWPDIGEVIGQAGIDFLLFFSFITPRICRDKWDSISNEKRKGASMNEQTCKCTKCPEKMTLCEPWTLLPVNIFAIYRWIGEPWPPGGYRMDDEFNTCLNCCAGERMSTRGNVGRQNLDCVCECGESLSGKKLTKKMGSGCSCDDGENKEDKYKCAPPPPDADTTWFSNYEWDEAKCKWCSKDKTEDCPEDCPCGGNKSVKQAHSFITTSTKASCSNPVTYGEKTISAPTDMELPVTVSIIGGADDVLLLDGQPINKASCPSAGNFCHTFTLTNSSFTIAARDNYGGNAGYTLDIIFCPK